LVGSPEAVGAGCELLLPLEAAVLGAGVLPGVAVWPVAVAVFVWSPVFCGVTPAGGVVVV
jgi:hypothetical protein